MWVRSLGEGAPRGAVLACSKSEAQIPEGHILRSMRVVINRAPPRGVCDCQVTNIRQHLTVCGYCPGAVLALTNPRIHS